MANYRVGIWAAVSSRAQAGDDKSSLQDQEAMGRRFAESVGGQVVAIYLVPGHSRDIVLWQDACAAMPAYQQWYDDVRAGKLDVLHALSADRLGRDAALVQAFFSLGARHACEIYLASSPHALGQQTTASRIVPAILGIQAQSENEAKVHRQRQGMRRRVIRERLIGCHPPFGYEADGKSYKLSPSAVIVQRVTELFLQGLPYVQIVQIANQEGWPAPMGARWHYSSIRRLLLNDTYAGMPRWGMAAETPTESYPVIWDVETYRAIVGERMRRKRGYTRQGASPFTGVAFCARCGKRMTRVGNHGHYYQRCSTHARASMGEPGGCHANLIPERRVAEAIGRYFAETTEESIRDTYARRTKTAGFLAQSLDEYQKQVSELHGRRERLAHAFASGKMAVDIYSTTDRQLLAQEEELARKVRDLEAAIAAQPNLEAQIRGLLWLRNNLSAALLEKEPATVAKILQDAGLQVLVEEHQVLEVRVA